MDESQGTSKKRSDLSDQSEDNEIRVTDRRRIHLDGNGTGATGPREEESSLVPSYVEQLEARTKAAEQKVLDIQSRFEQSQADLQREMDETRRRLNRAADERAQRDRADFIASLLPVMDNLRRAIEAAENGGSVESIINGMRSITSTFENALLAAGVEPIASVGQPFAPELHEAVDTVQVEPERDGEVTVEYARGYKIGERLLRPARVQVGRARAEVAKEEES